MVQVALAEDVGVEKVSAKPVHDCSVAFFKHLYVLLPACSS